LCVPLISLQSLFGADLRIYEACPKRGLYTESQSVNKTQIKPNDRHTFFTTAKNVETATGDNLLSELRSGVQSALAAKRDTTAIGLASKNACQ
jgi:hypothetical protein